jgi:hypothetical protein
MKAATLAAFIPTPSHSKMNAVLDESSEEPNTTVFFRQRETIEGWMEHPHEDDVAV